MKKFEKNFPDLNAETVKNFLKQNPQFLEHFLLSPAVSREQFQKLAAKRIQKHLTPNRSKKNANKIVNGDADDPSSRVKIQIL